MATAGQSSVVLTNSTAVTNSSLSGDPEDPYDSQGAMFFIIAVIVVYGIAVIAMLGFYNRKEIQLEDFDKQASRYVKEVDSRYRRMDIKSRKSVLTKRLSELRYQLTHDHVPKPQNHVANYLVASIGMTSRQRSRWRRRHTLTPPSVAPPSVRFEQTSPADARRNSLSEPSAQRTDSHRRKILQDPTAVCLPIARISDNNVPTGRRYPSLKTDASAVPQDVNSHDTETRHTPVPKLRRGDHVVSLYPTDFVGGEFQPNEQVQASQLSRLKSSYNCTLGRLGVGRLCPVSPVECITGGRSEKDRLLVVEYESTV